MNYVEYEVELANTDPRPLKRPRQRKDGDDGHRPYNPQSGPSGVLSEVDDGGEASARKGRKRPLSCGECRRYLQPTRARALSLIRPIFRLKLKVLC